MRNAKPPMFRPAFAPSSEERLAAWRKVWASRHPRPGNAERGYGKDWKALRAKVLVEEPWCRTCLALGDRNPTEEVDHILSVRQRPDLRLVRSNLQGLCGDCHKLKTNREDGGFGRPARGAGRGRP